MERYLSREGFHATHVLLYDLCGIVVPMEMMQAEGSDHKFYIDAEEVFSKISGEYWAWISESTGKPVYIKDIKVGIDQEGYYVIPNGQYRMIQKSR